MGEFSSDDELDAFDREVAEAYHRMQSAGRLVRPDVMGFDVGSDSAASSVAAWLFVAKSLDEDSEVATFHNPSVEELQGILATALTYDGDWYHSRVTLLFTGEWSSLEAIVTELPSTAGVFLSYEYSSKDAMLKHFGIEP